jgi:hypothetical protein
MIQKIIIIITQFGNLKIPVHNFGQIIEVLNRFHCCPKSQKTSKNVQKFSKLAKKIKSICRKPEEMFPRWLKILGRLGNFIQVAQQIPSNLQQVQMLFHMKESMLTRTTLEALHAALLVRQKMEYFLHCKLPLNK